LTAPGGEPIEGLDLGGRGEVDLGGGWTLGPCESGPPLFCARLRGETRATVELQQSPVGEYPAVKRALDAGGTDLDALRAHAAEYQGIFEKDRPEGCGQAYTVERIEAAGTEVGGLPGVVYGFDGRAGGRHVERVLQFATIRAETIYVISTTAVEPGSCMDDGELAEFTIGELTSLQPVLTRVIAGSRLP
jgi:hypothetical protein